MNAPKRKQTLEDLLDILDSYSEDTEVHYKVKFFEDGQLVGSIEYPGDTEPDE